MSYGRGAGVQTVFCGGCTALKICCFTAFALLLHPQFRGMDSLLGITFPIVNPIAVFLTVLLIILLAPMLMRRLHIPHIVGMIVAGLLLGPYALNILPFDRSIDVFGQVGLYYIMFLAGLEIDIRDLRKI